MNKLFFFYTIGSNLANNIECVTNSNPKNYLTNKESSSIYLDFQTHNEILTLMTFPKNNKAESHGNITSFLLKTSKYVITPYLKFFLLFVFDNGLFSNNCKIARAVSIYKKRRDRGC